MAVSLMVTHIRKCGCADKSRTRRQVTAHTQTCVGEKKGSKLGRKRTLGRLLEVVDEEGRETFSLVGGELKRGSCRVLS